MNARRLEPLSPRGPVPVLRRSNLRVLALALVAGLMIGGAVAVPLYHSTLSPAAAPAAAPAPAASSSSAAGKVSPLAASTHGDLVVAAGQTVYLPDKSPPSGATSYYQGGNITVEAGGTLIIQNTTLIFVQYIGSFGTLPERLSHIFSFVDNGTVLVRNSTLTSDTFVLNPFPRINLFVDGTMTLWNSKIDSAGYLNVGAGGDLTLNASSIGPNQYNGNLSASPLFVGALDFAPTLDVESGGEANLFGSAYRGLFADNFTANGTPGPQPVNSTLGFDLTGSSELNSWITPNGSQAIAEAYLYPGILGGNLTFTYNDTNKADTTASVTLRWDGVSYPLTSSGPLTFEGNHTGTVSVPMSAALIEAINLAGITEWLNLTGDFGVPGGMTVWVNLTAGDPVYNITLSITLNNSVPFGLDVSGTGSTLYTVDSFIGLNFSRAISLNFSQGSRLPWEVHQILLTDGANAYLGNLTVNGRLQNGTSQFSNGAIVADDTSHAYLFRWAQVAFNGRGGSLPVPNATLSAPYAYDATQLNNATVTRINNFAANEPSMWAYLQYWATQHNVAAYGKSNTAGIATLLLASNNISGPTEPDGQFLGDYHVTVTPPAGAGAAASFNLSVSPYPRGVANGSAGYGVADSWGSIVFPGYYASTGLSAHNGVVVTADGVATDTIRIGQNMTVALNVSDMGTAPITNLAGTLLYNASSPTVLATAEKIVDLTAPGQNATVSFTWQVNDTVVGDHKKAIGDTLAFEIVWNKDLPAKGGGTFNGSQAVTFDPSEVSVTVTSPNPPSKLSGATSPGYLISGDLYYNGSSSAFVELLATPVGGGNQIYLGGVDAGPGKPEGNVTTYAISWNAAPLTPGKSYTLSVEANYNGVTATHELTGTYGTPGPSATHFLTEKILGLPVWEWLAIAGAIVVIAVGFLLWTRQRAVGKLVECGECGNLIPEDAKVCPKCGAEFEQDVVRCSRCSSTIPANSQYCPECAAQLLGKPGEEGSDPQRQAYADFTERYRAEAKKELGENYSEGAFWDWWKRQPTYTPFSQWKLQQGQGTSRTGMSAPPAGGAPPAAGTTSPPPATRRAPGSGGAKQPPASSAAPAASATPAATATTAGPSTTAAEPAPGTQASSGAMKPCPSCGKEIPPEYLVCPFCGSVTQ